MFTHRGLEKIERIQQLLGKKLKDTGNESGYLSFAELKVDPLLSDQTGLEKTLDLIKERSHGSITWKMRYEQHMYKPSGVANSDHPAILLPPTPVGVEIHVPEPKELDRYFKQIMLKVTGKKFDPRKIELIEMVLQEDSKALVFINQQYTDDIKVDSGKKFWGALKAVAEDGSTQSDEAKSIADYFNKNKLCPLYSNTDFNLSEVLVAREDRLYPSSSVKIRIISARALTQARNKLKIT